MNEVDYDLAKLLRPVEPESFFRDTWEKAPLHVDRGEPGYYGDLFKLRDVDSVIACTRPKFLEPRDFETGPATAHNFVQGWLADDEPFPVALYPHLAEVHQAFRHGKTVILKGMEQRWPPLSVLARRLEGSFACPVQVSLYLTPRGAQGFSAHFDTHEVFVLQIEGSKHWRFYGPARDLPLVEESFPVDRADLGAPTLEAVLHPGDLLYMPRGHVHEAFTSDGLSLHLSVGVRVFRWIDLLQHALVDLAGRDVRFREALPPGLLAGPTSETMRDRLSELLAVLAERGRADNAVDRLLEEFLGRLPALPGCFFAGADAEQVGLDTVLEHAPGAVCRVIRHADGRVALHYPGNRLDGPLRIAAVLEFLARTPRFAVRALPGDLSPDSKLLLVRRLVRERFLTVVEATTTTE
jgi:hypothetical protein